MGYKVYLYTDDDNYRYATNETYETREEAIDALDEIMSDPDISIDGRTVDSGKVEKE